MMTAFARLALLAAALHLPAAVDAQVACTVDSGCNADQYCDSASFCRTIGVADAACDSTAGLGGADGVCVGTTLDCLSGTGGQTAPLGTCTAKKQIGETCTLPEQCVDSAVCDDLNNAAGLEVCIAYSGLAVGQLCRYNWCNGNGWCDGGSPNANTVGTCAADKALGASCGSARECEGADTLCSGGVCTAKVPLGGACTADDECAENTGAVGQSVQTYCIFLVCALPSEEGGVCEDNDRHCDCADVFTDVCTCEVQICVEYEEPPEPPSCDATQAVGESCAAEGICRCSDNQNIDDWAFCPPATELCTAPLAVGSAGCHRGARGRFSPGGGDAPEGSPALGDAHCAGTAVCVIGAFHAGWTGVCAARKTFGQTCDAPQYEGSVAYHTQCPGGYCASDRVCTQKKASGAACDSDYECGYDLYNTFQSAAAACEKPTVGQPGVCKATCGVDAYGKHDNHANPGCTANQYCGYDSRDTDVNNRDLFYIGFCKTMAGIGESCGPSASDKPCAGTINDGDWTFQFEAAEISPKGCIAVGAVGGPPADTPVYECQALKNSGDTCDGTRATPAAAGGDTYTSGKADVWTFTYDGQCVMGACDDTTSECTVRYNTPCTTDIECGDFFNCFAETDTCLKKCALWNRLRDNGYGTGLIQEQCADGDFCDRESCRPRAAIGEACSPSVDNNCVQGAYCFELTCMVGKDDGEGCNEDYECKNYDAQGDKYAAGFSECLIPGALQPGFGTMPSDTNLMGKVCVCTGGLWCQAMSSAAVPILVLFFILLCICGCCVCICRAICPCCHTAKDKFGKEVGVYVFQGADGKPDGAPYTLAGHDGCCGCCGQPAPSGPEWEPAKATCEEMCNDIQKYVDKAEQEGCCKKRPNRASVQKVLEEEWLPNLNEHLDKHHFIAKFYPANGPSLVLSIHQENDLPPKANP